MEFFCYHRDRAGSTPLRSQMVEQHWSSMHRFAATMVARGPTFTSDGTLSGSVHILDLPDPTAARAFAFEEPGYQSGAYRDVLLRRRHSSLGRTMFSLVLGAAVLLEARDADEARDVLSTERYTGIEVHQWQFGGRPNRDG